MLFWKKTLIPIWIFAEDCEYSNKDIPVDNEYWKWQQTWCNDKYGVIYYRTNDANLPSLPLESNMLCIHSIIVDVSKEFQFWGNISNGESETYITHYYGDNDDSDDTYNDTTSNQVDSNNAIIILDEYNIISPIKHKVNKEYLF